MHKTCDIWIRGNQLNSGSIYRLIHRTTYNEIISNLGFVSRVLLQTDAPFGDPNYLDDVRENYTINKVFDT